MASFQSVSPVLKASAGPKRSGPAPRASAPVVVRTPPKSAPVPVNASPQTPNAFGGDAGQPLPASVKSALENSFRVKLDSVRVHQDGSALNKARSLSARAFAYGSHIYLGHGEKPTDLGLMGHEVAHVVQQQHMPALQRFTSGQGDGFEHEACRASAAAARGQTFSVSSRVSSPRIQKLGLGDILDGLASLAANIPGYTLLTVIIGFNPINAKPVERSFANILQGFMGLIPLGNLLFQILQKYGIVDKIGAWVSDQLGSLGLSYEYLRKRFTDFTDTLSWTDIFSPGDVWKRAKDIFTEPIQKITTFISRIIDQAIVWLKETFMEPLSDFCRKIPGYGIVTVLLGKDPFTGAAVPRSAINVVKSFAEFIPGGSEKVDQLVQSKALENAYKWFVTETAARNLTWERAAGTFTTAWNSLKIEDVLHPVETIQRIVGMFTPLLSDLVGFAGAALMKLLELIFEAVMGAGGARVLALLKKGRDTFLVIVKNPVGFLGNLIAAVGKGISQFSSRILEHLKEGVIAWLTGPVAKAGVQMPEKWDLKGIIWFVLQILGLTWSKVRQKLVKLLGEPAVALLEKGLQLFQEIREKGIVQALKDRVSDFFGQLKEAALGSIRSFIQQKLVMAGITQLLSMLNPVGAVIQAIIKTYTTVMFFIDKINQILDLVESIVNSIAAIAAGAIGSAANFIEKTMAKTIPVILDFLARFIGLGNVGEHVQKTIIGLQAKVDVMLDKAVDWIKTMAKNLASNLLGGDPKAPPGERLKKALDEAVPVVNKYAGKKVGALILRPMLLPIKLKYQLASIDIAAKNKVWVVIAKVNPEDSKPTQAQPEVVPGEPVKVGEATVTPTVTYATGTLQVGKASGTVGVGMTAEYLAPNHPQGSGPGDGEQAGIFAFLPTLGKLPDGASNQGGAVYIKGHLLNDNLGGPGVAKNLFPITGQANANHKTQIEGPAKTIINTKGLLASYKVTVSHGSVDKIDNLFSKDGNQMYKIPATFTCILDTYKKDENDPKKLIPMKSPVSVIINSTYTGGAAKNTREIVKGELATDKAAKMDDFNADKVKWAPSHYRK
jgi:hypothetical protein